MPRIFNLYIYLYIAIKEESRTNNRMKMCQLDNVYETTCIMITIIYNISSLYLCLVVGPSGQLESKFKCEATNKWFNEIQIYICIYKEIGVCFLSLLFICRHTFCLTSSLSDPLLLQIGTAASERSLGLIYNL